MQDPRIARRRRLVAAGAALSLLVSSAALAQNQDRPRDADASAQAGARAAKAIGGAKAPNARLAALIDAGGAPVRTKGVQSVQRTDVGLYCIRPKANTNINPSNAIVIVSVDYFYSGLDEVMVQTADEGSGCGSNRIGIYTLQDGDQDGNYVFSDNVGFSVLVP